MGCHPKSTAVFVLTLWLGALVWGCSRNGADERRFTLDGQVIAVASNRLEATIKHAEIKSFMPAMTMPYRVKDARLLSGIEPGDLIRAVLVVVSNDAFLADVRRVGHAPLEAPASGQTTSSGTDDQPAKPAVVPLQPGDAVPDGRFIDQDGRRRDFRSFKGAAVVLTFIYTRCPMPAFCPLMDRQFAAIQDKVNQDEGLRGHVHLVTVTFDPEADSPSVLRNHAKKLGADPGTWTFLTGTREDIDPFAARFGLALIRAGNDPRDITHTLRTAVIDRNGRLVRVYTGNDWSPDQVLGDLAPVVGTTQ